MAADRSEEIAQLLQQGLDAYGEDDVAAALAAWRQVLAIDPDHDEARDFIVTADRRSEPRPGDELPNRVSTAEDEALGEARRRMAAGEFEQALELLRRSVESGAFSLEREVTIELVRSRLFEGYRESVGHLACVPMLATGSGDLTQYDLPPDAGFLLSLIDGVTDLASLVTLSGMDTFDAFRTTKKLIDVGIVTIQPGADLA